MKKLTLNVEALRVESFATDKQSAERGTVVGHYGTTHTEFGQETCDLSCMQSCNGGWSCLC
ncbi:MAG: hypothetical protein KY467_08100 [Gemmatimonadetes bacterium]|nr:hypothetical protein [Gemmatimonadota bacterium]